MNRSNLSLSKVIKPQAGWYRGEFHAHTHFSDGFYAPPDLAALARSEGLDFFAITDHNTIDAYPHFGDAPEVLIIPGMEITMKEGHYNVFGLEGEFDWLADVSVWPQELSGAMGRFDNPSQLMQHAAGQGLLNSINHPLLRPWAWLNAAADLRFVHCLEIVNDPTWSDNQWANPQAVAMWTRWLNAGYRITAIGGTDYHMPQLKPGYSLPQRLGGASTFVYAENLSGAGILNGVRQRRVYVSLGPQVTFWASHRGKTFNIGGDMGEVEGNVEFCGTVSHTLPVQARLIKNGTVIAGTTLPNGSGEWQFAEEIAPGQPAWYRLDVIDEGERILAVTNPIFAGPPLQPAPPHTYGAYIDNARSRGDS